MSLAETTRDLDYAKEQGALTPAEAALDPRIHTTDEIRATICAVLRQSKSLDAVREATKTAEPDWRDGWFLQGWGAALDTMLPCLVCESSGREPRHGDQAYLDGCDNAESATKAYLDAYRMNVLAGSPGDETVWLDNSLAAVFDAYPGRVPEPVARDILALLDRPHDLAAKKDAQRLDVARRVEWYPKGRASELQRRMPVFLAEPFDTIRFLMKPNETAGLLPATDRALALVGTAPYLARDAFASIAKAFPHAQARVTMIRILGSEYHRHRAMAAIAHAVLALKQYKSEHGSYPETLEGLTPNPIPALPVDPERGRPLRYALDGEGFTITQTEKANEEPFPIAWKAYR